MSDLIIRHTHADGTTLEGSTKGDGVLDVLRPYGFQWRSYAGIHIPHSRDSFSWRYALHRAAEALEAAGHTVTLDIDDTWRPAAVRAAERGERASARVERLEERAEKAQARSDAAHDAAQRIADGIPFGQPVLADHHSAPAHRRALQRIDDGMRKSVQEADYAKHLAARAEGSAANEAHKQDPRAIMRRIDTLKTEIRAADRALAIPGRSELSRSRRQAERDRDAEEITYLEGVLAAHAETGTFVAWGPDNIAKGDRVRLHGTWYPVTRVNKKTVSVGGDGWPNTIAWDRITGRRRGDEQLDTPNGEPWPVADADKVASWASVTSSARAAERGYGDDAMRTRLKYRDTLRIALGLPISAGDPEVTAAMPPAEDVPAQRAFAILCLGIHRRLNAGELISDVAASTVPFATTPAWRLPTDHQPEDVRVDQLEPGDLVAGIWDRNSMAPGGRVLRTGEQGPVLHVSEVRDRRESGRWVTITYADGARDHQTHVWAAVHRAGTWEEASESAPRLAQPVGP